MLIEEVKKVLLHSNVLHKLGPYSTDLIEFDNYQIKFYKNYEYLAVHGEPFPMLEDEEVYPPVASKYVLLNITTGESVDFFAIRHYSSWGGFTHDIVIFLNLPIYSFTETPYQNIPIKGDTVTEYYSMDKRLFEHFGTEQIIETRV